ncbi:glycosyltransferase family 4 protein [Novosphingobium sp. NBM11]|uniref:glycosyltransferase n=1 Tax=Novosphingobium sp. NBM11 TaxID=2596914 RepID=UPI0018921AF4|nr:glycosyltransferase [Novosphingobium sp. NBM11]MBF5090880.1 glycosyltransferase family 4 protein [Novosphingobium sp. NBM11]
MARIALRPFIDLLPYRIDQALIGQGLRGWRVRRRRSKLSGHAAPRGNGSGARHLYIDLAVISRDDAGTGIQRVVRGLALALLNETGSQWDVRFVSAFRRSAYHLISWPNGAMLKKAEIRGRPGDVFLGLDFSLDAVRRHRQQLAQFKQDGGALWFLVCDLLPVQRPEWFSPNNVIRYKAWLEVIAGIADGFFCISPQTQAELATVMKDRFGLSSGYHSVVIPMGHDIMQSVPSGRIEHRDLHGRPELNAPFTLIVGTLEPRKGHADILAAYSELWRKGASDRLVLVGRMGWRVGDLREQILSHPEFGKKLLWLDDVDDDELELIYQGSQGVIIASLAEGFGLPLIEALGYRKPVLARDLPIFRQHEKLGVRYFPANGGPTAVAAAIASWIEDIRAGGIAVTAPSSSWQDATQTILDALQSG